MGFGMRKQRKTLADVRYLVMCRGLQSGEVFVVQQQPDTTQSWASFIGYLLGAEKTSIGIPVADLFFDPTTPKWMPFESVDDAILYARSIRLSRTQTLLLAIRQSHAINYSLPVPLGKQAEMAMKEERKFLTKMEMFTDLARAWQKQSTPKVSRSLLSVCRDNWSAQSMLNENTIIAHQASGLTNRELFNDAELTTKSL
jgi:hypothetical protein